jgi:predicted RNase H-like HicB family nuclease
MKQEYSYTVFQDGDLFVAQCLEVDVASQGESSEEAIANLREALELHFEPPVATITPQIGRLEIDVDAA